ncbi:hypothetical protein [Flavobacterium sp. FlaQc-48]|uniref:hypothetical protein n=1 Tax=Flavobacterium sp. FlaQc-48 TaxID=3374181 RepID=UPI0037567657
MQNQQKSIPPFRPISSKPMLLPNLILGLFWVSFALFFVGGIVFLATNSLEENGLDEIATGVLFFVFITVVLGIILLLMYSRKKMSTTTIIDEKGIRYLNTFKNRIVKDLPWSSFEKREKLEHYFEPPKYDITSTRPSKSFFEQFYWPVLVDNKVIAHNDAFTGKHFFVMLYANRPELIRTFLLGVKHYRPDITIDPIIFANNYIDPESFVINHGLRRRLEIIGTLLFILILVIVYYFVENR